MDIKVGVSNRHVHLTQEHLNILFGEGYELTKFKDLNQPGQYSSNEKVEIKTEKNSIKNVRVLGPIRSYTQVEISKTDAYLLGLNPPIRDSGDIISSSPITIIGPNGKVELNEGCIIANRHIHATNEDLKKYNLDKDRTYDVSVPGIKGGIISNVKIKVDDNYAFELHIDTDDANAHLINNGDILKINL